MHGVSAVAKMRSVSFLKKKDGSRERLLTSMDPRGKLRWYVMGSGEWIRGLSFTQLIEEERIPMLFIDQTGSTSTPLSCQCLGAARKLEIDVHS